MKLDLNKCINKGVVRITMREDAPSEQPRWVEPHIRNLAKIHDLFDAGSLKIREFMKRNNVKIDDFEKYRITLGNERDSYNNLVEDQQVSAYLKSLTDVKKLYTAIQRECTKNRPIDEKFDLKVRTMDDIENPPKELFGIHNGEFPLTKSELCKFVKKCRTLRNTAGHIPDTYLEYHDREQRITWKDLHNRIVPLTFEQISQIFITGLQVLEYVADGSKELIDRGYVETQLRRYTERSLTFNEPDMIKRALGANKWDKYIEVEHIQDFQGESSEPMAINWLDFLLREESASFMVEINGLGGLGKTKLAREYISRSIDGNLKYRPKRYQYYIYYSAKSTAQGEQRAEYDKPQKSDPRNWKKGGGDYVNNLNYDDFIQEIQGTFNLKMSDLEERIIELFTQKEIFVLLDNFEDVSDQDIPRYKKFFSRLPKQCKSRFVITSRRTQTYGAKSVELDRFNKKKALEMLYVRYQYEIDINGGKARTNLLHQLRDAYIIGQKESQLGQISGPDLIDKILRDVKKSHDKNPEVLERNLRHPLYLRYLANLLVNSELIKKTEGKTQVTDVLVHIIDDPTFKFWEWHENVVHWMLEHAYNNIKQYKHTLSVLRILLYSNEATSLADLISKFQKAHPKLNEPIKELEISIRQIKSHREFIDEKSGEGELILTSSARKYLASTLEDNSMTEEQSDELDVTDEKPINYHTSLQQWMEESNPNHVGFRDGVYRLSQYLRSGGDNQELCASVELKLFNLAHKITWDTIDGNDILDLIQISDATNHQKIKFDLICSKAQIFTQSTVLETLGNKSTVFSNILLGKSSWPQYAIDGPEAHDRGHVLILLLMLERHGIQTKFESLISCIGDLLERMELSEIEEILAVYDFADTFQEILLVQREAFVWTFKMQGVFNWLKEKTDMPADAHTDKFAKITPSQIDTDISLSYEPNGESNFENFDSIYTVNWDLYSNILTVYVKAKQPGQRAVTGPVLTGIGVTQRRPREKSQISGRSRRDLPFNPFAAADPFIKWTSSSLKNCPGLSVDPLHLACDLFMVCELYSQVDPKLLSNNAVTRANKLKSLYKKYYRGSVNTHSVAFIVGYHIEIGEKIRSKDASEALEKEFTRRIKRSDEHSDKEVEWTNRFKQILMDANKMLDSQELDVKNEISRRKKLNQEEVDVYNPDIRAWQDWIAGKQGARSSQDINILKREKCNLRDALKHPLKSQESPKIWIQPAIFRSTLIRSSGNLQSLINSEKVSTDNAWNYYSSWLDSIVEFVFSNERDPDVFKKYKFSDEFVEKIEDYHYRKWSMK